MNKDLFSRKLNEVKALLPADSHLLLVSKTRSVDEIRAYYELGQRDFGENRVQELLEKAKELRPLCPEIRWHMIGNLQTNKINQLFSVPCLWAIHSVDDPNLLEKLLKAEHRLGNTLRVFLQYNTSREDEKSGFEDYASLLSASRLFSFPSSVVLQGLMTMGTLRTVNFEDEARRCFKELRELKTKLESDQNIKLETSMGMSRDYSIAIAEGSNWIRLGTMMFN